MIKLVLCGLLFSAVAINASPVGRKPFNAAAEARRLVHQTNWAAVATISTDKSVEGYPMASLLSTADSNGATSTGDIYFYMLDVEMTAMDTKKDNRISFMFSDAQEGDCNRRSDDPWSHKCPRVTISGLVQKLDEGTEEYNRGKALYLDRHPTASSWVDSTRGHSFYLCKLDIKNVIVFAGRYHRVTPEDYQVGTDPVVVKDA